MLNRNRRFGRLGRCRSVAYLLGLLVVALSAFFVAKASYTKYRGTYVDKSGAAFSYGGSNYTCSTEYLLERNVTAECQHRTYAVCEYRGTNFNAVLDASGEYRIAGNGIKVEEQRCRGAREKYAFSRLCRKGRDHEVLGVDCSIVREEAVIALNDEKTK